jgi:hypothetical protein
MRITISEILSGGFSRSRSRRLKEVEKRRDIMRFCSPGSASHSCLSQAFFAIFFLFAAHLTALGQDLLGIEGSG